MKSFALFAAITFLFFGSQASNGQSEAFQIPDGGNKRPNCVDRQPSISERHQIQKDPIAICEVADFRVN